MVLPKLMFRGRRSKKKCEMPLILVARSEGFEPPTPRFEVWCSIQLSYERLIGLTRRRATPTTPCAYGLLDTIQPPVQFGRDASPTLGAGMDLVQKD